MEKLFNHYESKDDVCNRYILSNSMENNAMHN